MGERMARIRAAVRALRGDTWGIYKAGGPQGEVQGSGIFVKSLPATPTELWNIYLRVSWVRACVNAITRTATSRGWVLEGNESQCARARDLLLRPNLEDSGLDLMVNVFEDLGIFGRGFWELVRGGDGPEAEVVAMYTMDPVTTKPVTDKHGRIEGFKQLVNGRKIEFETWQVVHFPLSTKGSEAAGISPLQSLVIPLATDIHAQEYNLAFFKNDARPRGLFKMKGAPREVVERNRAYMESETRGATNAHKDLILEGEIDHKDLQKTPQDMQFLELRKFNRDEVLAVYGVPPSKIGIIETGNIGSGSGKEQDKTFKKDTVEPLQAQVQERVTRQFIQNALKLTDCRLVFNPIDVESERDLAEVEEIKAKARKTNAEAATALLTSELITAAEAREMLKLEADKAKAVRAVPARRSRLVEKREAKKGSPRPFLPEGWLEDHPDKVRFEEELKGEIARMRGETIRVARRVGLIKRGEVVKGPTDELLRVIDEGRLGDVLGTNMKRSFETGLADGIGDAKLDPGAFGPLAEDFEGIETRVVLLTDRVSTQVKNKIRAEVAAGIKLGEGADKIAARINGVWDKPMTYTYLREGAEVTRTMSSTAWADLVSRTETMRGLNDGRISALKQAGIEVFDIQLTTGAEAECQQLAKDGPYALGEAQGLLPVHPNCRCTIVPSSEGAKPSGKSPQQSLEAFAAGGVS